HDKAILRMKAAKLNEPRCKGVRQVHCPADLVGVGRYPLLRQRERAIVVPECRSPEPMHRRGDVIGEEGAKGRLASLQLLQKCIEIERRLNCPTSVELRFICFFPKQLQ